jgi:hypothetical protein
MSDKHSHDDHWRRLAEELGLDVGPAPEQSNHSAPPELVPSNEDIAPSPWPTPIDDEPPPLPSDRGRHRQPSEPPQELPEDVLEPTDIEDSPPARGRRGRPSAAPADDLFAADAEGVATDDTEVEGIDAEQAVAEPAEGGTDDQTGKRRRRRRSRRKKKGEPTSEAGAENGAETTAGERAAQASDDDDEEPTAEVVRNWNVPSWDELIASLHRPER